MRSLDLATVIELSGLSGKKAQHFLLTACTLLRLSLLRFLNMSSSYWACLET